MDPAIANQDLSPPRVRVLARGLVPAIVANVVLIAALAGSLDWKRGEDRAPIPPLARSQSVEEGNDTARMGAPPMPSAAATVPSTPVSAALDKVAPPPEPKVAAPAPAPEGKVAALTRPSSRENAAPAAASGSRPSFDCKKAHSSNERLICRDPELARLDRELGRIHAQAKRAATDPVQFKRENDDEWQMREAVCRDKACLRSWYAHRREQLEARLAHTRG